MTYLARARERLTALAASDLRRTIRTAPDLLDFSSNDYLGLSRHPAVLAAAQPQHHVGSGGSRLLAGAHDEHTALEIALAAWLGRERALLFSSGYLAALGAIGGAALLTTTAYSDRDNHACIIDALRLSRLERHIYDDLPPQHKSAATIVSETIFSMSGRRANVAAVLERAGPDDIVILDEAHAIGVSGPAGAGLAPNHDDPRIVILGTLSKALGSAGGFVAGPAPFIELLISTARSFIFDTSLPPSLARAALAALARVRDGDDLRERLHANVATLTRRVPSLTANGPIVALHVGAAGAAVALSERLRERGIVAPAIRPPTVPHGSAQLRIIIRADHTDAEIERLAAALLEVIL